MKEKKIIVTRFAPSPTGELHVGSAFAAMVAFDQMKSSPDGEFLIRFENIDLKRCNQKYESKILEDLSWLGITSNKPIRRQSEHMSDYEEALNKLKSQGLIYPCFCSRKEIIREIKSTNSAPHKFNKFVYPGTCRNLSELQAKKRQLNGENFALRLKMDMALSKVRKIQWTDPSNKIHKISPSIFGDIVIARKETPTSYHLAVTVDDHIQGVTVVTRAEDLYKTTSIHRLLQEILGFDVPQYLHHPLILDTNGERFQKRNFAVNLSSLRKIGVLPRQLHDALFSSDKEQIYHWIDLASTNLNKQ
tara:strand:- start:5374 stop:6285 length:912 start_codon:yes stop_codon:yes gene_type:complete